jgi:hypothetical protein
VNVNKRVGAALSGELLVSGTPTFTSITMSPLTSGSGNGQTVEYSICISSENMDFTEWQDSPTFDNLIQDTEYTVVARTKANDIYQAGTSYKFCSSIRTAAPYVAVANILEVPSSVTAKVGLPLSGVVLPDNATNKTIVWSVKAAGTTGATISENILNTTASGTVTVTATIINGLTSSSNYTKDFVITVSKGTGAAVSGAPTVFGSPTANIIIVNAVSNSGANGQAVEYAISTGTGTPTSGWQDDTTFDNLSADTNYYVFARTKENAVYNAGVAQRSVVIKTAKNFVPVSTVTVVSLEATATVGHLILGTVSPGDATNRTIAWSVKSAGTTGATISGNTLNTTASGTVTVTATIVNGLTSSTNYTQDFYINVSKHAGAEVSGQPLPNGTTSDSITVNAVSNVSSNGQTVEYAISKSDITPETGWQTGTTFSDLEADTIYYAHARTAENETYNAGTARYFGQITTAKAHVAVTNITEVPLSTTATVKLSLSGAVTPSNATNKTIVWSVKSAGTTGATILGYLLSTSAPGTVTITATIVNGLTSSTNYTQDFDITVNKIDGANVIGTVSATSTYESITVNNVIISGDGSQTIEYAISKTSGNIPADGWQDERTFNGLDANTDYYVYARSKGNDKYNAGSAKQSSVIKTKLTPLTGTATISGTNAIGQTLTVNTDSLTGGSGAYSYQWKSGFTNVGSGLATYTLQGTDLGKAITCVVTRADAAGSFTATFDGGKVVPYSLVIVNSGNVDGDTIVTLDQATGRIGDSVKLSYVLGNDSNKPVNYLKFTGVSGLVNLTTSGENTEQNYIVESNNAINGIITITATFQHLDLIPQILTFTKGNQVRTFNPNLNWFSSNPTSDATDASGAFTYTSSDESVATVSDGNVTVLSVGTTTISVTRAADGVYSSAEASYLLTVNNASQSAPTNLGKTDETTSDADDGVISGVNSYMEYKLSTDEAYLPVTGSTISGLAPGIYNIRYKAKQNYNASPYISLAIAKFVSVTDITGVPATKTVAGALYLDDVLVAPSNAKYKTIEWSIKDAGSTGANVSGGSRYTLTTIATGIVTITATILGGAAVSSNYTKDFTIVVTKGAGGEISEKPRVSSVTETYFYIHFISGVNSPSQTVEYAISETSGVVPTSGWQTSTTFNNLTSDTVYYVYARAKENEAYYAGSVKQSDAIKTAAPTVLNPGYDSPPPVIYPIIPTLPVTPLIPIIPIGKITTPVKSNVEKQADINEPVAPTALAVAPIVKATAKAVIVTIPKTKGATSYIIRYKTGKSKWKSVTVKGSNPKFKKITKLKKGKKYTFQIRSVKKVGNKTYKAKWSKARSVKVK